MILLLPGCDLRDSHRIGEKLRALVEAMAMAHPDSLVGPNVTVSVGVSAVEPRAGYKPEQLIAAADHALYAAKSAGRNRVVSCGVDDVKR